MTTGGPLPDEAVRRTVVTLDGPAGSGKSTTARAVAERLGYRYLDSGALYRALTFALLHRGVEPAAWPSLDGEALRELGVVIDPSGESIRIELDGAPLGDDELRGEEVTARVSTVAALPAVRAWLLGAQRAAAARGRLVADGRDMGTVVFPWARAKVFLDASAGERARRRLGDKGRTDPTEEEVAAEGDRLQRRDAADRARAHAPLVVPDDALVLDTTGLDFGVQTELVVEWARGLAESAAGARRDAFAARFGERLRALGLRAAADRVSELLGRS